MYMYMYSTWICTLVQYMDMYSVYVHVLILQTYTCILGYMYMYMYSSGIIHQSI